MTQKKMSAKVAINTPRIALFICQRLNKKNGTKLVSAAKMKIN